MPYSRGLAPALLAAFFAVPLLAADPSEPVSPPPDDASLEAAGARIGAITVVVGEIFDPDQPGENRAVFRAANKVHIATREGTIRRQLTFREGDAYSRRILDESERILRHNGYLYDASIRPVRYADGRVDVEVRTRDVWTLKAGIGFKRAGGVNRTRFGLHDSNFLGTGKDLEVLRTSGVDRTETLYAYRDEHLLGSRLRLDLGLSDNSDGSMQRLAVERPFYSLDTRWAAGVRSVTDDHDDSLYALGEVYGRFHQRSLYQEAYGGWSRGARGADVARWTAGFTRDEVAYETIPGVDPGEPLAEDRTLAYPWIGYERIHEGYVRAHDLDKLGRTEDVDLGRRFSARLGWTDPAFGADRKGAVFGTSWSMGLNPGPSQILQLATGASGRLESDGLRNGLADAALRYYRRDPADRVFFAGLRARGMSHPDGNATVLLGGEEGLRGYPLRYAVGTAGWVATVEERFYFHREYGKLLRVGAAVFFDAGSTFGAPDRPGGNLDMLRDVGVGLRLGQSRSAHASMVHVDLAYPLDRGPGVNGVQLVITTGETF